MSTFTVVNDNMLCEAIAGSRHSVVYVAPGISEKIVNTMHQQLQTNANFLLTLIVDIDPEVYRLGYGTLKGLEALQVLVSNYQLELRQQTGLRIGLLICDGRTLVYSPTPLLIEAGSTSPEKPNAIWVEQNMPQVLTQACITGVEGEIGKQAVTPQSIDNSLQSLSNEPPKKFDIARIERVYHSKIQFVELEVTGYRLLSKKIPIPNDLLIGDSNVLKDKLKNSFKLFNENNVPKVSIPAFDPEIMEPDVDNDGNTMMEEWDEIALESERKKICDDYLINVPGYGSVILCRNLTDFENSLNCFRLKLEAYTEGVYDQIKTSLDTAIADLVEVLVPRIRNDLPKRYIKYLSKEPSDDAIRKMLHSELHKEVGDYSGIFAPKIRCVFKGVTYESINDHDFINKLKEAMIKDGAGALVETLFSERDAALESK